MIEELTAAGGLFPACAGVILFGGAFKKPRATFPRMRGGDPRVGLSHLFDYGFSPHARG